jgi:dTDP-4-dehydrorhamnose 3,5-epimerase
MKFLPTAIDGAFFVETERMGDARGGFARTYCRDAFREAGLDFEPAQCSISTNPVAGTLRGMHFQRAPHGEAKLVCCVSGAIFDVAIDLRSASPTFGKAVSTTLCATDTRMLFIPPGLAHGFLTLEPMSSVHYMIDVPFRPGAGAGVRWNDPAFAIEWPAEPRLMSERDGSYPDFDASIQVQP